MFTRNSIISEYFRLCELVRDAEEKDLLDADEAQVMRERYHERAELVLAHYRKREGAPLARL